MSYQYHQNYSLAVSYFIICAANVVVCVCFIILLDMVHVHENQVGRLINSAELNVIILT